MRRNRVLLLAIIMLACVGLVAAVFASIPEKEQPVAKTGVLDASRWNFATQGNMLLDGEWEFYANQLLTPSDFHPLQKSTRLPALTGYVQVPELWERYPAKNGSPYGYGTFRLLVKVPPDSKGIYGIIQNNIRSSHLIFVNGQEMRSYGKPGVNQQMTVPFNQPDAHFFALAGDSVEVVVQVANFHFYKGGINKSLLLGDQEQIESFRQTKINHDILLATGFFLPGLYFLSLFFMRRQEKAWLYFGLFCVLGCFYVLGQGEKVGIDLFPDIPYNVFTKIQFITGVFALHFALVYTHYSFPQLCNRSIVKWVGALNGLWGAVILLTPTAVFSYLEMLLYGTGFFIILCMLYVMVMGAIRRLEGAVYMMISAVAMLGIDMINLLGNMGWRVPSAAQSVTIMILVFAQVLLLSKRFTNTYMQAERLSERLLALDRLKDEFLANTSHEMKTPLHGIINIAQSLLEGAAGKLNDRQEENVAMVVSTGKRMANLVNDILDLAKLKNGEIVLNRQAIALQPIVQAIFEMFRYLAEEKSIRFIDRLPDQIVYVYADEDRLMQIMVNLLGNALKFTSQGEIAVSIRQQKEWAEISVQDTGIGIPEDKWESIFESFEQTGSAIAKEYGGTGLGLSITRRLVELHGGSIHVDSTVGIGSVFTFTLPIAPGQSSQAEEATRNWADVMTNRAGWQTPDSLLTTQTANGEYVILVVDDDPTNLQVLISLLSVEKYAVIAVSNGEEALRLLERGDKVDLVITDLMMPGMSGLELCRRIRERYSLSELPLLMLTARNWQENILASFEAGANDFLGKPVDAGEMKVRIRTLLELKQSVHARISSEMAFLQAQIKPHFLFNTLNTIMAVSESNVPKAQDLLAELSHYLRGSFDFQNREQQVTLRKELELVESYLTIEKARFGERLQVEYDVDETIHCLLPPLIIQPLVENAVRHGVMERTEGGTVKLSVQADESHIVIAIADDGIGMAEEIKLSQERDPGERSGVGLRNIERRLRSMYGTGLEIESAPGQGTNVMIRLPRR